MSTTVWTITSIKAAHKAAGLFFFSPETMRFWATRVVRQVFQGPGGVFFITEDDDFGGGRCLTVRQFDPETSRVWTVSGFSRLRSKTRAIEAASALASGNAEAIEALTKEAA